MDAMYFIDEEDIELCALAVSIERWGERFIPGGAMRAYIHAAAGILLRECGALLVVLSRTGPARRPDLAGTGGREGAYGVCAEHGVVAEDLKAAVRGRFPEGLAEALRSEEAIGCLSRAAG